MSNLKSTYLAETAARLSTRREVIQTLGAGCIVLVIDAPTPLHAWQEEDDKLSPRKPVLRLEPLPDGRIMLRTGKVELGQGARTLLTQCVAEELQIDPGQVNILMGDTDRCPDDGGTWASSTTPETVPAIRRAAAQSVGRTPRVPQSWTQLGRNLAPIDGRAIVTGAHKYASDHSPADYLHAVILRPPSYNGDLLRFQAPAKAQVVRDQNLLAVLAPTPEAARRTAAQVQAEWKSLPLPTPRLKEQSQAPVLTPGARYPGIVQRGDIQQGLARLDHSHRGVYSVANIAHVPLEPRAACARWEKDHLYLETGTQAPFLVRRELAQYFKIPESRVHVRALPLGSGYGGKQRGECELEAARLARSSGQPVRLAWTREDEFNCAYFRPAGLIEVESRLSPNGRITAWDFHNYNAGASSLTPPYDIPDYFCAFHRSQAPLREGSYRSLAAVANNFARESHIDELAHLAKSDPLEFRLRHITDARLREALERGAERFGWSKLRHSAGMAVNLEKDARLALFVHLEMTKTGPRLLKIVNVFDPGAVLNPNNLQNQVEGAIIQGLGGALFERVRYDRYRVLNPKLSQYRVPRFRDVPPIETILVDRRDIPPAGAGESPITTIAPALANAIFAVTGERRRSLPLNAPA